VSTENRRDREREARRQGILDAAEAHISQYGLAATKMSDVAQAAELSKGALYLYFQNKSALCAALAERSLGCLVPKIQENMDSVDTGLEQVALLLRTNAEFMLTHPSHARLAMSWLLEGSKPGDVDSPSFRAYRARIAEMTGLAHRSFEAGQRDGSVRGELNAMSTCLQLWGALLGNLVLVASQEEVARRMPVPLSLADGIPQLIDVLLAGIAAGPRAST